MGKNRRRNNGNVAGAFDNNFKVRVNGTIDSDDLCRAVRRCLVNDLVAGAEDDNRNDHDRDCCCHNRRRSWI
ncbi:hypothetical protein [Bacillus mesophilum]|uniref:Uncharacterized protein n=1 Tax=Bacillus mesophilum TaxID=1071718 RepID=A0A7V7UVW2_9BACI|nr:hypothetical protein [Bacillus mesophilum]KAB2332945.1 hypothetical protein F7732_12765 [Bacillus mesophilum]